MISLVPQLRVLIATEPTDFRKGIDSLAAVCRARLGQDPFSGALFVFRNRRATAIKILAYDGHGFWLCLRRFSYGRLRFWPKAHEPLSELAAQELAVVLFQGDPTNAEFAPAWRRLALPAAQAASSSPDTGEARDAHRHGTHEAGSARTASASRPTAVR